MYPTDRDISNLVKKMQKQVARKISSKENLKKVLPASEVDPIDVSSEVFNEMKKLPFTP